MKNQQRLDWKIKLIKKILFFLFDSLLAVFVSKNVRKMFYEKQKMRNLKDLKTTLDSLAVKNNKLSVDKPKKASKTKGCKTLVQKASYDNRVAEIMKIHKQKQDIFDDLTPEEKEKMRNLASNIFFNKK